jgi:acyl-CoA synthetase (AMP-forming)/AMP-acid ligase II
MSFTTFNDMLRRAAMRVPDKTFLHWVDRDRKLSYAEGEALSGQVAGALARLGVRYGDRVGIFAHNGLDYIMAMFGAWKLGAISCHFNVLQAEELDYFVDNATPKALIYTHDMLPVIDRFRSCMPSIEHYLCMDGAQEGALDWNVCVREGSDPPSVPVSGDDPAHLSYTSGSSGRPKGAVLAHGPTARAAHCIAERLGYTASDFTLGATSPASSYGLVANLLPAIHRGATIGLMSWWDAENAWEVMNRLGVTVFPGNPLLFAELLSISRRRGRKPSALRLAVSGGAPVAPELKRAFLDELGVFLVESYGQSELGGFVALGRPQVEDGAKFTAIGPALPDKEVRIMDETSRELPIGHPGEMCIRGGFMIGYWNQPDKNEEVIRNGWLHTGDMGVMDEDGYISMLGRWSERIVSQGRAIFPRPMEEVLFRHPAVQYAAVIGKPDHLAGELIKAVVALHPGQEVTVEELENYCRREICEADCPEIFEVIDEMPMTATGKIGRAELQRMESERRE